MTERTQSAQDRRELAALRTELGRVPPITLEDERRLLAALRAGGGSAAQERLVEGLMPTALDEAGKHTGHGIDAGDLYQEATLAVVAAVREFAARDLAAPELAGFVRRVVAAHLDDAVESADIERRAEEAFVRDAQLYETVEVGLRRRLGREATPVEIASLLEWPPERVELMAGMLTAARTMHDGEIVQYLDDEE